MISSKLNVGSIFADHFKTLRDDLDNKPSILDWTSLYLVPGLAVLVMSVSSIFRFSPDVITPLVGAMALFGGLLFNLLVLLRSIDGVIERTRSSRLGERIIAEVYANIAYAILVSMLALIVLVALYVVVGFLHQLLVWAGGYLVAHFLLVLVMVLKRTHRLMTEEFRDRGRVPAPQAPRT